MGPLSRPEADAHPPAEDPPTRALPTQAKVPTPHRRTARTTLPWALLTGVLGLAAAAAVVGQVDSPHIPGAGQSPVAFVISSARNTVDQKTADVIFSGSLVVDGHTIPMA